MTPDLPSLQPVLARISGKVARLRGLVLPETFRVSLEHKLEIELTHGSTAIEGNTLTLRETQLLIDEGIAPSGSKRLREIYETVNHHKAVLMMREWVREGRSCEEAHMGHLRQMVMEKIDDERAGRYRVDRVMVTGAPQQPLRPALVPEAMRQLFAWIGTCDLQPVLLAGEAHYRFVKIHPFYDGNGRTARLLMNWLLLDAGYPLTVIPAEARSRYITSIDEADRGRSQDFFTLLGECVESSLDQYLNA